MLRKQFVKMAVKHYLIIPILAVSVLAAVTGSSTTNDPEMDQLKVGDDSAPSVQENVTAEPGETVILPCRNPKNIPVKVLEWHRANSSQYVLSYRDEQLDSEDQDPSFINRVDVKDRNMTHGDLSLIMTNVTTNDTGIYECRAFQSGPSRMKREILVVSIVNLKVAHSGQKPGARIDGLKGALYVGEWVIIAVAVVVAVTAGICIYKIPSRNSQGTSVLNQREAKSVPTSLTTEDTIRNSSLE
ncbi:uncharacterized protein LOC120725309 isoform X2 [Simochromis diagramma]|uniref:uncharacterized protein LOC120725309 isoform X2 n=1 Tax=Simochromis diagramma TaxID=43689 RepID=UPI001A7E4232|nr:uncharacterized protein LOC120725309 isoform X2 [Simochromis diagramma]